MKEKKVISYSVWGDNPVYTMGALRNAQLANEFYPGWECWFYCAESVPREILKALRGYHNVRIIMTEDGPRGYFHRFFPIGDPSVAITLVRDCDSRFEDREVEAVNKWLKSSKPVHVMRDHPAHTAPIMAGMWGVKSPMLIDIVSRIKNSPEWQQPQYGADQRFLARIWPTVTHAALVHNGPSWPTAQVGIRFVGQQFNQHDEPLHPETGICLLRDRVPARANNLVYLNNVPVHVVSGVKFRDRQARMTRHLHELNWQPYRLHRAELGGSYYRSVLQNHLTALTASEVPFVILEDDATPLQWDCHHLTIPEGTDAVYLGISSGMEFKPEVMDSHPDLPRVVRMLGMHAILYCSEVYVNHLVNDINTQLRRLDTPLPIDVLSVFLSERYCLRACKKPLFYQHDGHNDEVTKHWKL